MRDILLAQLALRIKQITCRGPNHRLFTIKFWEMLNTYSSKYETIVPTRVGSMGRVRVRVRVRVGILSGGLYLT